MPVAAGHVVARDVAGDVVESVGFGDVFGVFADYDGELAFVVAFGLAEAGNGDGRARVRDGVGGFDEEGGVGGEVEAGFEDCKGRVISEIILGEVGDLIGLL